MNHGALLILFSSRIMSPHSSTKAPRRWLIVLNPVSGNGKSRHTINNIVAPILDLADIVFDVTETKHQRHATEIAQSLGEEYTHLAISGGDGLVAEAINGNLLGRNVPVAVIPTGSDNSTCASLGMWTLSDAIMAIVKGEGTEVSIGSCSYRDSQGRDKTIFFHSVCAWGVMGVAAWEIQKTRHLGPIRTLVVGFKQLACKPPTWPVHVRAIVHQTDANIHSTPPPSSGEAQVEFDGEMIGVCFGPGPGKNMAVPKGGLFPHGNFSDGALDLLVVGSCNLMELVRVTWGIAMNGKTHLQRPTVKYRKIQEAWIEPNDMFPPFNLDGEAIHIPPQAVHIQSHARGMTFFTPNSALPSRTLPGDSEEDTAVLLV
eukprot:c7708_g1_i1.p1 GENE.c7708_g1_i1~~c7708_g1_i1.p1  ORF type:complete len:372 (+),score=82.75 c7708_g1_i1:539-1654(+)